MLEGYINEFIVLANSTKLTVLVALILVNFVIGTAVSIYTGQFRLKAIADFMLKRVLPYIIAYFGVVIIALVEPDWKALVTAVWAILLAALIGHILGSLKEMGVPIPDFLAGRKPEK